MTVEPVDLEPVDLEPVAATSDTAAEHLANTRGDVTTPWCAPGVPVSWLSTTRPPLGIDLDRWARTPWHAREVITRRAMPPPPSPADPPWRLAAIAARDELDERARAGAGHVRHSRAHRRNG